LHCCESDTSNFARRVSWNYISNFARRVSWNYISNLARRVSWNYISKIERENAAKAPIGAEAPNALGPEILNPEGHRLLGLGVEGWVHDQAVHEQPQVILNLK